MELFSSKKLKRKDIAEKLYECHKNEKDTTEYINDFLKIVEDFITKSRFETDEDFIFGGRKKFLYEEFYDYLNNKEKHKSENPIRFAIGNLEEFICNNNFVNAEDVDKSKWIDGNKIDGKDIAELRDRNDKYSNKGYICLEEKEYIEKMLKRITEELKNIQENQKLSRDEVDNYFNEIYKKDNDGKYVNLKFQDYKGEINYIGKKDGELNIDEIVRLKKSYHQFYELFDKLTVDDIKSMKMVAKILETPFTEIVFYTSKHIVIVS